MSWQTPNGNWNANASTEESLRAAARLNAQRSGALGQQQLTFNEQLALQNLGLAGAAGNPGFQNYQNQPGLFQNQFTQAAMGGGQGLHFANGNAGAYGKLNQFQNQAAALGLNNFTASQQNSALVTLLQQQMLNLQQNGGFQNTQQANLISNNLAQALALAQQQSQTSNLRNASLANNPALNAYLYRLQQQQQALAQNARQMNLGTLNAAQILQQQALQQQANQLQAAQQQQQMSANMAALLRTGNSAGFGDGQVMGGGSAPANQSMNLVGFNSTGLANSPLASAPLLPILGTDLAKPSQRGMTHDAMAAQAAISSPDIAKQMEALSIGAAGNRSGSVNSLNDLIGRTQAMSPTGLQQKDAIRTGLSSPTPVAQVALGQTQTGTTVTSPSAGSKDRDLTTLKTLGQMLAKTGNTVESAVQNGLLGGCNAEDVKIVWEAYVLEAASLKQYDSANKAFQKQGAELVAKRAKSDDPEATKLLLEAAKAPTASVPATLSEALQCLGMDSFSTPPNATMQPLSNAVSEKKKEAVDDDSGWDGIIENEHDYVPHHLIDEVNTPKDQPTNMEIPKENAFNAENYGFFALADADNGLADCELEEEGEETTFGESEDASHIEICREQTKSEENNITAEDDLPDGDSINPTKEPETKESPTEELHTEEPIAAAADPAADPTAAPRLSTLDAFPLSAI